LRFRWVVLAAVCICLVGISSARADSFPVTPVDQTGISSFGPMNVYIVVNQAWRPYVQFEVANSHLSGWSYNTATGVLSCNGPYDPAVMIGNSKSITAGSNDALNGTTVGVAAPATISTGNIPVIPASFTGVAGTTNEVIDKIVTMNATTNGGTQVRVGTAATDVPASVGMVQSLSPSGVAANDFPAQSFFDVFADITIPFDSGSGTSTFGNTQTPMVIQSSGLTSLPSIVLPHFTISTGATIYAQGNGPGSLNLWYTGDSFGTAYLGGVGASLPAAPLPPAVWTGGLSLVGIWIACRRGLKRSLTAQPPA
jgi:hypothetical protein